MSLGRSPAARRNSRAASSLRPSWKQSAAQGVVGLVVLGLERDRTLIGPLRLVEPRLGNQRQTPRDMGRGERRLQPESQLGRGQGLLDRQAAPMVQAQAGLAFRDPGMGAREIGIELHRLGEQAARDLVGVPGELPVKLLAAEIELVGVDVAGRRLAERVLLARQQLDLQHLDDAAGDLVLHREHVGEHPVVALGPQIAAGVRVHELRGDPDPLAGLADAALQDVAHPEPGAGVPDVQLHALEGEGGVARGHEQPGDLGEIGDQIVGDAVAEKILIRIVGLVGEGQHRDRLALGRPWRRRRTRSAPPSRDTPVPAARCS